MAHAEGCLCVQCAKNEEQPISAVSPPAGSKVATVKAMVKAAETKAQNAAEPVVLILKFFSDPGHGWLRVPRETLMKAGVMSEISSCSYERGEYVYLEEDSDAPKFLNAARAAGWIVNEEEHASNSPSMIRQYRPYQKPEAPAEITCADKNADGKECETCPGDVNDCKSVIEVKHDEAVDRGVAQTAIEPSEAQQAAEAEENRYTQPAAKDPVEEAAIKELERCRDEHAAEASQPSAEQDVEVIRADVSQQIDAALETNGATMDPKIKEVAAAEIAAAIGQTPAPVADQTVAELKPEVVKPAELKEPVKSLHAVFSDSKALKDLLQTLAVLADEVTFTATADGIKGAFMDPSRVAMYSLNLPKSYMKEYGYEVDAPEGTPSFQVMAPMRFCFNLSNVTSSVLKNLYSTKGCPETVTLDLKDQVGKGPDCKARWTLSQKLKRQFKTILLEPSDEEVPSPKVAFTAWAKIVTADLQKALLDCPSDHFRITIDEKGVLLQGKGDLNEWQVPLERGSDTLLDFEAHGQKATACFSISYLNEVLKQMKILGDLVTVQLSTDMPMCVELLQPEMKYDLKFWIAPRIETEGD